MSKSTGSASSWLSSGPECYDSFPNHLVLKGTGSIANTNYAQVAFEDVKNSRQEGLSNSFTFMIYNPSSKIIVERSYGTSSSGDVVEYVDSKQDLIVDSDGGIIEIAPGTSITLNFHTISSKMPARSNLTLEYAIKGKVSNDTISFAPNPIVLKRGEVSAPFTISASEAAPLTNYTIH